MPQISPCDGIYHVTLTPKEMALAQRGGQERYEDSRARGLIGRGITACVQADVEAAAAELAVALLLGQDNFVPSVGSFHDADLVLPGGKNIQIRSTSKADGGLIWRDGDALDELFILVVGKGTSWTVVGCNKGRNIRERGFALGGEREECRIMPQCALVNLDMIPWLREFLPEGEEFV